jgi:hypothetical protein
VPSPLQGDYVDEKKVGYGRKGRNSWGEEECQAAENKEVNLVGLRSGRRRKKDVKNEGRTDYVHENTGACDKMSSAQYTAFDSIDSSIQ